MKKFYSIVLMATALLIGTNVWAGQTRTAASDAQLQAAWAAAQNGDVIQLTNDITLTKPLWLGTVAMNDAAKSITLNLGGKTLTADKGTVPFMFIITHGELNVENGNIIHSGTGVISSNFVMFHVCGSTYKNVDPKTAKSGYFTHLNIASDVKLTAHSNAIAIDRMASWTSKTKKVLPIATYGVTTPASLPYNANVYNDNYGVANGVRVDVYGTIHANKYGIKANGNMGSPATAATAGQAANYWADPEQTIQYVIAESDVNYAPFIYVHSSAEIKTLNQSSSEAIATYSAGYSRWLIEGYCEGSTGVYVKSGEVTLDDAVIKSNFSEDYIAAVNDRSSGVDAGGSGIVVESATKYAGNIDVTVQGDTKVTGTTGYAIDEAVTAVAGVTKVDGVTITGGTFETGENGQGAIKISEPTAAANAEEGGRTEITIAGGQAGGSITLGDPEQHHELDEVVKPAEGETSVHVTYVDNGKGGTTMVISQGDAPQGYPSIAAAQAANEKSVKLTASDAISGDVVLDELEINQADPVTLTISKSLTVGRVVLGSKAQIIVEPGAKFIVDGKQGIVAPVASNILLKSNSEAHAIFLFNPGVISNRHPNATVQFLSKSFRASATNYQWERFGIPTWDALTSIESDIAGLYTDIYVFENNDWQNLGQLQTGVPFANLARMNKPFATYNLLAYKLTAGATYTLKGELVGNENAKLNTDREWNSFANSYVADLDIEALLTSVNNAERIDPTVYYAKPQGLGHYSWEAYDKDWLDGQKISPMEVFLLRNNSSEPESSTLNYASMVYAPAVPGYTPSQQEAPRRFAKANDNTARLRVIVANEEGVQDNVKMTEKTSNLHNAVKYMNDDLNIYAMADEKAAIVAAENLENTYVGFSTVKGGNFTISFANVEGREFTLVDHATGARVEIAEGNTYEFTADANSANDYRFEIVGRQNMPTAIDNTEAVKSVKGVYTITGQYVGEMNVWNTLPAGVYVVNGEKRVK